MAAGRETDMTWPTVSRCVAGAVSCVSCCAVPRGDLTRVTRADGKRRPVPLATGSGLWTCLVPPRALCAARATWRPRRAAAGGSLELDRERDCAVTHASKRAPSCGVFNTSMFRSISILVSMKTCSILAAGFTLSPHAPAPTQPDRSPAVSAVGCRSAVCGRCCCELSRPHLIHGRAPSHPRSHPKASLCAHIHIHRRRPQQNLPATTLRLPCRLRRAPSRTARAAGAARVPRPRRGRTVRRRHGPTRRWRG